ncbi:MAG: DUF3179 domain-containing protein [Chloroflexi bacterium]|nr:DUF3179 domain-containing protein [Chloroflexota bacterium]
MRAQSDCDPLVDGRARFPISYWELTDFCLTSVDLSEIISGGPPPDGIPPIDNPQFETIEQASSWLEDRSPVIALEVDGDARAYPLAILTWHEIVNDEVGGVPVAVTFCPLCNAGLVFERTVSGEVLRFGVSGLLRNSDMIMWDDATQSFWQQLTGEGIVGAFTGTRLAERPSTMTSFGAFAARYPDGTVLSRETGVFRDYGRNPYTGYDSSTVPFLYSGDLDDRLPPMARVLGFRLGQSAVAYDLDTLAEVFVINDDVEGIPVAAFWQPGVASALDATAIDDSRDVGMAALYDRQVGDTVLTFTAGENGAITDEQTGSTWDFFGTATSGELAGTQLNQLLAAPHFWFAWSAFFPETTLYTLVE